MRTVPIGGQPLVMSHTASADDDSETLEFWQGSGRSEDALVVAVTFFDRPVTPLLVHAPGDVPMAVIEAATRIARDWITQNLPQTDVRG